MLEAIPLLLQGEGKDNRPDDFVPHVFIDERLQRYALHGVVRDVEVRIDVLVRGMNRKGADQHHKWYEDEHSTNLL